MARETISTPDRQPMMTSGASSAQKYLIAATTIIGLFVSYTCRQEERKSQKDWVEANRATIDAIYAMSIGDLESAIHEELSQEPDKRNERVLCILRSVLETKKKVEQP